MIKVGITGGIGSGKSLICQVFLKLGVPVYNADNAARYLMDHDPDIRRNLISVFGEAIYIGDKLNRSLLSGKIFDDPVLLAEVNKIVHPAVGHDFVRWYAQYTHMPFVIQESAILFESNITHLFDYIILITAPEEIRIKRVLSRPGMSREKVMRIMHNQIPEEDKMVRSHFILKNDGINLVLPNILSVYSKICNRQIT